MGGDHPITWCQNVRRRPVLVHRPRSRRGVLHRRQLHPDAARRHPDRGRQPARPTAARRPATPRCSTAPRPASTTGGRPGPGGFTLANGTLTSFGGMGLLWYPVRTFANYSLKLDWMMPGDDNGGVFIGFPDPLGDPWNPVNQGHEIQIDATDADPSRTTGSVYSFPAPNFAAAGRRAQPARIVEHLRDRRARPAGRDLAQRREDQRLHRARRAIANGYIGVQNDGAGADINYRNIRIKTDGGSPPATDLAQGKPVDRVQRGAGARTSPRTPSTATRPPAGAAPTPTRSRSPSTSGSRTTCPGCGSTGRRRTGGRTRSRRRPTTPPGRRSTRPPPATAASTTSRSPAPAATCG